jgi:hypothetical protein
VLACNRAEAQQLAAEYDVGRIGLDNHMWRGLSVSAIRRPSWERAEG